MYAKVFAQMYDGTLCTRGPWEALVTFQQLLVLADLEGNVDMTPEAISRRTTIPIQIIKKGIETLLLPDAESRTPTDDGKRIVPLSEGRAWGWKIVNYLFYRGLKREEDRREYHRNYWNENRSPKSNKRSLKKLNNTQRTQPNQPIAEAEAEAVKRQEGISLPDWIEKTAWKGFVAMRAKMKKPLTPRAIGLLLTKLEAMRASGQSVTAILDQSTMNNWVSVYDLKSPHNQQNANGSAGNPSFRQSEEPPPSEDDYRAARRAAGLD